MKIGKITAGVYITSDFIYGVWVKNTITGPRILSFKKINIKSEATDKISHIPQEERIIDEDEVLISNLKRLFTESKISTSKIFAVVSSKEITVRYFQMSLLPKKEWAEAIKFEAKKYIPFSLDEVVVDFQVLGTIPKTNKMSVLFVASKKEVIKKYLNIFNRAGIKIDRIEIAPLSLLRALQFNKNITKRVSQVLLEVDKDTATLTIHKGGIPYLIRDFSIGLKRKEEKAEAEETVPSEYDNLLRELQLSFEYYYEQFPSESIAELIFVSQEEKFKEWIKLLSKDLIMPVKSPSFMGKSSIPAGEFTLNTLISLGLALYPTIKMPVNINLFPVKVPKTPIVTIRKREIPRFLIVEAITFCISLIILYSVMQSQISDVERQIQAVISKREAFGLGLGELSQEEFAQIRDNLQEKKKLLINTIDNRFYWTYKLSRLPALLPDKIWINSLDIAAENNTSRRQLLIQGMVYTENKAEEIELVNKFISNLKQDSIFFMGFSEAELSSLEKIKIRDFDVVRFSISCYQ